MEITEARRILADHNLWRRGDDSIPETNPSKLGIAIETLLDATEWKPISSAPHFIRVLVRFPCGHIEDATIHPGGYSLFDGENLMSGSPTHWRPCPQDPS